MPWGRYHPKWGSRAGTKLPSPHALPFVFSDRDNAGSGGVSGKGFVSSTSSSSSCSLGVSIFVVVGSSKEKFCPAMSSLSSLAVSASSGISSMLSPRFSANCAAALRLRSISSYSSLSASSSSRRRSSSEGTRPSSRNSRAGDVGVSLASSGAFIDDIVVRETVLDNPLSLSLSAGRFPLLLRVLLLLLSSTRSSSTVNSSSNGTASSSPSPSLGNRSPLDRYELDVSPDVVVSLLALFDCRGGGLLCGSSSLIPNNGSCS